MALVLDGTSGVSGTSGTPVVGAGSIGTTELAATAVTAGTYGSASLIPAITVDAKGRLTSVTTNAVSGGVTSLVAGNGITVSGATGAVTVSQDFYSGSNINNTSFPVTSYIALLDPGSIYLNSTSAPYVQTTGNTSTFGANAAGRTALAGTWRSRGRCADASGCTSPYLLMQRTA
jgi:hypothetical protein